jgi:hypothetical protein
MTLPHLHPLYNVEESRDSSVGIAKGYRLGGLSSIPGREKDFSVLHIVQTDSEAHLDSYPVGIGDSFPRGKAAGA